MSLIDISDLNEATVLAALYNASRPLGMGMLHFTPEPMAAEEAAELLAQYRSFDYLKGRVMKIDFFDSKREEREGFNEPGKMRGARLYDRDNGEGATERVLSELRAKPESV